MRVPVPPRGFLTSRRAHAARAAAATAFHTSRRLRGLRATALLIVIAGAAGCSHVVGFIVEHELESRIGPCSAAMRQVRAELGPTDLVTYVDTRVDRVHTLEYHWHYPALDDTLVTFSWDKEGSECTVTRSKAAPTLPVPDPAVLSPECTLPHTLIGAVQGGGMESPLSGEAVTVQGVVVGDFEGPPPALGGFYVQDIRGDGDPLTSDGIFVANDGRDVVRLGDVVRVTGVVGEVREQTQISASDIVACGTAVVEPVDVTVPVAGPEYLERYEGMLVRLPQTLHVTEHYQLGRFGEVVLASGGRLPQPTNLAAPGAPALAVLATNERNRIILADASFAQNAWPIVFARDGVPLTARNTLRGGDAVRGIIGVLTQTSAGGNAQGIAYRVRPIHALSAGVPRFTVENPRPPRPPEVGGTLRVASFNLLNYFNTFDGCTAGVGGAPTQCRGASDAREFDRQWRKTIAAVTGLAPDVLGVIEIENDGYGPHSAIADLVARLNAATTAGRYAFLDVDERLGRVNALGTDAIKVGFVYRADRVAPVGRTAVLDTERFVNGGESGPRNRPSLAQAFQQLDGGRVVVSVNHLKSKGSPCDAPDAGDGQGNCNAARTVAAQKLAQWLASDPTGTGEAAVLIVGDLNAYAQEDPVSTLSAAGFTDLLAARIGTRAYSYVFNGQWGYLDHALASAALLPQVSGVAVWHINADEPPVLDFGTSFQTPAQQEALYQPDAFRSSDHDPVLVGLTLRPRAGGRPPFSGSPPARPGPR
jgi:uncharacterized protein